MGILSAMGAGQRGPLGEEDFMNSCYLLFRTKESGDPAVVKVPLQRRGLDPFRA
jgi:hypothetical protein